MGLGWTGYMCQTLDPFSTQSLAFSVLAGIGCPLRPPRHLCRSSRRVHQPLVIQLAGRARAGHQGRGHEAHRAVPLPAAEASEGPKKIGQAWHGFCEASPAG